MLGSTRGRSKSVPSAYGIQYGMQGESCADRSPHQSELGELREMLRSQQEQLNKLTQNFASLSDT